MIDDPTTEVSDTDLQSLIETIREESPFSGISMICGSIRSRGITVTRDRVRAAVKSVDPLGGALRWPAQIKRRPYSVPGPNSLWHIGELSVLLQNSVAVRV